MIRRSTLAAIAAATLCLLLAFAATALANAGIRLSPGGAITKRVDAFTVRAFGGEVTIICRLTLSGSLVTQIEKAGARMLPAGRMGRIESAATTGCTTNFGGMAEVLILVSPAAPMPLRYEAFLGVLPNVTGIVMRKLAFEIQVIEPLIIGTCLFRGPLNLLITFPPVEGGAAGRFNPEAFQTPNALPRTGGVLCPESVQISGAGRVQLAQFAFLL